LIGLILGGTRYKDEILEIGDLAIHDEEAFPEGSGTLAGVHEMSVTGIEVAPTAVYVPPPIIGQGLIGPGPAFSGA
jgi:hypothetical protein